MKLSTNWIPLVLVVALPALLAQAATNDDGALWRPRFATPAIVALDAAAHRQFTAEVRASASASGWSVTISNDLRAWNCPVLSATYAAINRGTEPGWRVKACVPPDTSPELFTVVTACSESFSVQHQSLSVTPSFATDFYILHIADEQIVNKIHTDPSGQFYRMVGSWDEIKWMQEPVNLINPRFVLITGDQIDYNGALDGWNNWSNWGYKPSQHKLFSEQETIEIQKRLIELYQDSHRGYRVPYAQTPGNHDVPPIGKLLSGSTLAWHPIAVPLYETHFGQRSWSFAMGDFYVLMHDWSEPSLKAWAAHDYDASLLDSNVSYRLVGQHFTTDQAFIPAACDLMLIGHGHSTATAKTSPYYIYQDGPAFRYGTTGFFNFRRRPNGWSCEQTATPRDADKDVWPLFTDHGVVKRVRSNRPDPMYIAEDSVTITNDLPQTFYDGRVRFVLNHGNYTATNGTVLARYDCCGGTRTALLVKVCIPPTGTVTVTMGASPRM
jgi:hypothetical protein